MGHAFPSISYLYRFGHTRLFGMEEKLEQKPSDVIKVVLFGPESTGKSTLSEQLADHYKTLWVPEYAREYLQEKWNREQKTCEPQDLLPIAEGQMRLENEMTTRVTDLLICDTDLLETKVYSEAYYLRVFRSDIGKICIAEYLRSILSNIYRYPMGKRRSKG